MMFTKNKCTRLEIAERLKTTDNYAFSSGVIKGHCMKFQKKYGLEDAKGEV